MGFRTPRSGLHPERTGPPLDPAKLRVWQTPLTEFPAWRHKGYRPRSPGKAHQAPPPGEYRILPEAMLRICPGYRSADD
ncbi:hypothetical protein FMK56_15835 [Klebsiella oxytoca]|uniref:Uncharacterized protein n=1 Tax=Klebsiella oxytoca TaxID=571 RepID=A0AAD3YNR1_KLEOX|nr:hypothetical protein EGY21_02435 [Klebsiella oxytoca]MBF8465732.1 hypothetical protein [Klebsiella oxytoca]MBZ7064742.1 hypothetical protein [Klebsiella oxytoca]MBZ7152930.1 hypothetical protein [Klebsiella oxytoca]MBZ7165827.1 hypothetical protein [Klebsiella oxytoca]